MIRVFVKRTVAKNIFFAVLHFSLLIAVFLTVFGSLSLNLKEREEDGWNEVEESLPEG